MICRVPPYLMPQGAQPLIWTQHAQQRWQERIGPKECPAQLYPSGKRVQFHLLRPGGLPKPSPNRNEGELYEARIKRKPKRGGAYRLILRAKLDDLGHVVGLIVVTVKV